MDIEEEKDSEADGEITIPTEIKEAILAAKKDPKTGKDLKDMLESINDNDFIDISHILMAKVQAKRDGKNELCKVLEELLPLAKDEEKRRRKEKNKKEYEEHQKDLEERKQKDVADKVKQIEEEIKLDRAREKKAADSPVEKNWKLFFITHIDNLQSILERGILSPAYVRDHNIDHTSIDDKDVNARRNYIQTSNYEQLKLEDYAHVFFNPLNAMFYTVKKKYSSAKIVMIRLILNVSNKGTYITDRNAAQDDVQCWDSSEFHESITRIKEDTLPIGRPFDTRVHWKNDGSKGKVMAECLVKGKISRDCFTNIFYYNELLHDQNIDVEKIRPLAGALEIGIKLLK